MRGARCKKHIKKTMKTQKTKSSCSKFTRLRSHHFSFLHNAHVYHVQELANFPQ